jgi:hypothetical protein
MNHDESAIIMRKAIRRLRSIPEHCAVSPVLHHVRRAVQSIELAQAELAKYRGWQAPTAPPPPPPLTPATVADFIALEHNTPRDNRSKKGESQ